MQQDNVFSIHFNSVVAISIRDMMERYGRSNIGFLWALIEPLILAVGVMAIWSLMKSPYEHGIPVLTMVFTGYLPLTLWRHITGGAGSIFSSGFSLMYHRSISLSDIVVARILMEFAACSASTLLVFMTMRLFNLIEPIERPDLVIAGWLAMALLSASSLALFACLITLLPPINRFYAAFQYLMLPISGVFFLLEWVPTSARDLFLYNPMVHCFEVVREGFIGSRIETFYNLWYVVACSLVFAVIAVLLIRKSREVLSGH